MAALWLWCGSVLADDAAVTEIIDEHWAWSLENYPEMRLGYGDRSGNGEWTDLSLATQEQRRQDLSDFAERLRVIEPAKLQPETRLNRQMLLRQLDDDLAAHEQGLHLIALDMRSGPQHAHSMVERLPFNTEQDYRDWLQRLAKLPSRLEQYEAILSQGITQDRVQAKIIMQRVPEQITRVINDDPEASPFYKAFLELPDTLDRETAADLRAEARSVITEQLNPAYQQFGDFISNTYLPAARAEPGIGSLDGGKAAYKCWI